jgi:hypothetical protein
MQIIDGFTVNVSRPIDDRMVTTGTASRDAIVYKYNGLRVYDTDSKQPYVWDGTTWVSENSSSVDIEGTTTTGFISKFSNTSQITNSIIQEVNNGIKILAGSGAVPTIKLDVAGMVQATVFQGSGNKLTNIPAASISGQLRITNIENPDSISTSQVQIITAGTSTPEWKKLSEIPSSAFPSPYLRLSLTSSTNNYIIFGATNGSYNYYQSTSGDSLRFIPRVNGASEGAQLQIPNGSEGNPSMAFATNTQTGIYRIGFNILGISVGGKEKLRATEQGVAIKSNFITEATLKVQNPGGRPFIGLYGQNADSSLSGTIGFSGLLNGAAPLNDFIIESFAGIAARSSLQNNDHFDAAVLKSYPRHLIALNTNGQTIISTNAGSKWGGRTIPPGFTDDNTSFTGGQYGCEISNQNADFGHGLLVRSGGGPNTYSARFDNGNKTIATFTNNGLGIMSGTSSAPSIFFDSDRNTGLFLEKSKTIGIVADSKKVLTISDTEIRLTKVSNLAYIFGDDTRLEGTSRTNGLEIYRPTTNQGYPICHFFSDLGGTKTAKAYIYPDGSYYRLSDRRQKENIKDIAYGLDEVMKLRPVTHTWLQGDTSKVSIGLIAQEVEEILSEVVNTSMDGETDTKALDYNGIIPVLIKSIQELNEKIKQLESK